MEDFWETLALQMIGRGFVKRQSDNPFTVHPNYQFWAPWIGRHTRKSNQCLNTEFEKIHQPKEAEICDITVSEDRLKNELHKKKVSVIRKLCKECGIDSIGSKTDLLERLSSEMKTRQTYDKVFEKIWGASGGWAVVMCPCGIVNSIKCCLRAESPRDFADILLSWKHIPNVVIYDFARGLATHTNLRSSEVLTFTPHGGRLADPTDSNIKMAKEGKFKISLPWLNIKKQGPDSHGHPITGSAEHYVLNDKFHEDNSKDQRDALRKIGIVAQLAGKVNSQVVEQFFSKLKKNNYFLNMTLPSTHIFLMRSIIHHHNSQKNLRRLEAFKRVFGTEVVLNISHQAVLATLDMSETSTQPHATDGQVTITSADGIMQEQPEHMNLDDADENSTQAWKKPHNPLQDKLLRYILDTRRLADEVIVKEGATCLTREDFWTLGLRRDMKSDIGNACMKIIYEDARAHGKDIYIADLYLVPTWKTGKDPLAYLPTDADMKDALVFPAWTQAAGPDHYVLCEYCTSSRSWNVDRSRRIGYWGLSSTDQHQ
ncbi:uncharacterized protein LOC130568197 isoform X2 [Triplophysa rosa]|uniref:uncharacterized protein LOC130568197 isoform X2 n=1 Tax=Triplophysa rosa TaxID=992332 RepID=UPI002545DC3B|nr:uncharacterized protein LOC130568197 isoform X2 [Triplophysa rosa]